MTFSLRPATLEDLPAMKALAHEGLRPHLEPHFGWDEEEHDRGFAEHFEPEFISIVQVERHDVGYFKLVDEEEAILLEGIYFHTNSRKMGLGTAVITSLLEQAEHAGKRLRLRVWKSNPAARLYRRLGFEVAEESEHQLVMER